MMEPSRRPEEDQVEPEILLLQDQELVCRIDAVMSGESSIDGHPDACPGCGNVEPGHRRCRLCGREIKSKSKDGGFWFQEVAEQERHQDALGRILVGADRGDDGAAHEWVTATLVPEPSNERDKNAVMVMAARGDPAELVGYLPPDVAPVVQKACLELYSAHKRTLACRGLIRGGSHTEKGRTASYVISLLLPLPRNLQKSIKAALKG